MGGSRARIAWGLSALACVGVTRTSSAQEATRLGAEPIRVDYASPPGCPSEEDFLAGVLARTARARRAPDRGPASTFVVTLEGTHGESTGHLVLRRAGVAETERDVTGDTCEEVASALALIAALAIDPNASTSPVPTPPPVVPTTDASRETMKTPAPREAPAAPKPEAEWQFGASVGASVTAGVAPEALVGVPIAVHAVAPASAPIGPTFHLAFERTSSGAVDVQGGAATFTWTVAVVEGCPHRWRWGAVGVEPCLRFEGGALRGQGSRINPAREDTRGWFALGAIGRAEWTFAGPLFLEIETGLRAPFVRTTYYFEPDTTIYRAPAIGALAGLGVGARLL
jgi:hypothetical protein